jgi:hypothetical protein
MSTPTEAEAKPRALSPREQALAAIEAQRNADFERETGIRIEASEPTIDPDIDPEAAEAEAERQRLAQAAEAPTDQLAAQTNAEAREQAAHADDAAAAAAQAATERAQALAGIEPGAKYKFKVNGEETELTGEEVLRRVQKDVSADVRMRRATEMMREAEAMQLAIQQQQAAAPAASATPAVAVDPGVTKKFTSALFAGDEDTATQAFQEAVSSAVAAATASNQGAVRPTPVDPVAIAAQVRQQIAIDSALAQSRQDYPQLYADPDIEAVAATKINRLVEEGKPFVDALKEVSGDMAAKFGWKASPGRPDPSQPNRRQEKLERKESLEPPLSGPNVKSVNTEAPQESVHDVIRAMARQRGQTV